jgi:hypothetical protein
LAGSKSDSGTMIVKLLFTIAGVLLVIAFPFFIVFLGLWLRFQPSVLAGVELISLVAGLVLIYLGFKENTSSHHV